MGLMASMEESNVLIFYHKIYIGIQLLDKLEVMQTNQKIVNNVKIITMDKYAL